MDKLYTDYYEKLFWFCMTIMFFITLIVDKCCKK